MQTDRFKLFIPVFYFFTSCIFCLSINCIERYVVPKHGHSSHKKLIQVLDIGVPNLTFLLLALVIRIFFKFPKIFVVRTNFKASDKCPYFFLFFLFFWNIYILHFFLLKLMVFLEICNTKYIKFRILKSHQSKRKNNCNRYIVTLINASCVFFKHRELNSEWYEMCCKLL